MSTQIQNFYESQITRNWTSTTGDFNVSVAPTISEGIIVISPSSRTLREIVRYTATGTNAYGPFVRVSNIAHRGLGGTTAQVHSIGEKVRMNITAEHWGEIQDDIDSIVAAGLPAGTDGQIMGNTSGTWVAKDLNDVVTEDLIRTKTVSLSSAELLALYDTPKELIPTPGVGKIIIPEDIVFSLDYGTAPYTGGGGVVRVSYGGETTQLLGTTDLNANLFDLTTDAVVVGNFIPISTGVTNITAGINKSLVFTNNTANFSGGDGTLKVFLKYRILTL